MSKIENSICEVLKFTTDEKIAQQLEKEFQHRAETGLKKYGVTLERTDLSQAQWLQHLKEELMDSICYAVRLLNDEEDVTYKLLLTNLRIENTNYLIEITKKQFELGFINEESLP
jgi:hypothetical protein